MKLEDIFDSEKLFFSSNNPLLSSAQLAKLYQQVYTRGLDSLDSSDHVLLNITPETLSELELVHEIYVNNRLERIDEHIYSFGKYGLSKADQEFYEEYDDLEYDNLQFLEAEYETLSRLLSSPEYPVTRQDVFYSKEIAKYNITSYSTFCDLYAERILNEVYTYEETQTQLHSRLAEDASVLADRGEVDRVTATAYAVDFSLARNNLDVLISAQIVPYPSLSSNMIQKTKSAIVFGGKEFLHRYISSKHAPTGN